MEGAAPRSASMHLDALLEEDEDTPAIDANTPETPGQVQDEKLTGHVNVKEPAVPSPPAASPESHPGSSVTAESIISIFEDSTNIAPTEYVNQKIGSNRSSLDMRKLPVNILLRPAQDDSSLGNSTINDSYEDDLKQLETAGESLLHKTCLNARFSLRDQMMLSFGSVSSITIVIVVAVSLVASVLAGNRISDITQNTFDKLAEDIAGTTAHYLADDLTPRILPDDLVKIIHTATKDRFAGYPIYANDAQVPFKTLLPDVNHYPLEGPPLPLDWQMENGGNVNETNFYEHVQDRLAWYDHSPTLDTASAAYYIQGMCDPAATDPSHSRYFPNCTEANNDLQTGGSVVPTSTSEQIHRKAKDLSPLFKSLYEYHQDVKNIGLYFSNSGAGSTMVFPHYEMNSSNTYKSAGCNWLLNDHPVDPSRTLATLEDFQRCELNGIHNTGNNISTRLYNPLDRDWCRQEAMNPNKIHHIGPFESAWNDQWLMLTGKAVYDEITKEFVACIAVDFVLDSVDAILLSSKVTNSSEVSVVRFADDGIIIASTAWNRTYSSGPVTVDQLDVGLSQESFQTLQNLVDYNVKWDPKETVKVYEKHLLHRDGYLIAAYPMPPVPKQYQADYVPEFLVVVSVAEAEFFRRSGDLQDSVAESADQLERTILIVGVTGLGMMVVIIFMVAGALTAPLMYMNEVAGSIVQNFGDTIVGDGDAIEVDRKILDSNCVPKTELGDIVKEFLKMVRNFSGSNMARSTREKVVEIENRFSLVNEFRNLYRSRSDSKFKYDFPVRRLSVQEKIERKGTPNHRVNFGRNISKDSLTLSGSTMNSNPIDFMRKRYREKGMRSPLFFWIVVLIVTPLLLTTITISVILMYNISKSFPDYVDEAKEQLVEEEIFALSTFVGLRANLTAATTERAIRDLHVLTRYISWVLFGGLNLSNLFTEMTSTIEECKTHKNLSLCPAVLEKTCDCSWGDQRDKCANYEEESRFLQPAFYAVQSHDAQQTNGDRFSTSYPDVSYSQETTAWWGAVPELPGYDTASGQNRYESTYDRVRSVSSLPVLQLLQQYDKEKEKIILGVFVAFEGDGIMAGYEGCKDPGHPLYANWTSNVINGAYELRPELCPLGKYGYDPRCRNWYDKGRHAKGGNKSAVFATPPYLFAGAIQTYGQSASSPLIDPKTGQHVGNTLVDYISQPIVDSLNDKNFALFGKGFPILITVDKDNFGADTVIGPGMQNESRPIAELVLPDNPGCEDGPCEGGFYQILKDMKAGKNGTEEFTRIGADGKDEDIYISYAPVVVKTFAPVDASDFSRGVSKSEYLLYSLAFAEYEDAMLAQFHEIEDDIDAQFYITLAVLCLTIVLSIGFVVYFSNLIAVSMTEPMLQLLELVRTINGLKDGEDRPEPPLDRQYGSREVLNVTCTMERLYKVIRSANTAFFAGDVETAYQVLREALQLFKRLGNTKAIGVACNNLGNTLLAAYRVLKKTKEKRICGFKKREIIAKGTSCFHEAIQQGEKAYDEFYEKEGWSPNCLNFMQHLSNRYFNRAMFLLTVKDDHSKPADIQELGMRDLQISRDMDVEIVDEGSQAGWNVRGIDMTFEVMLSRFKGHLSLLEMGYPDDFDLEEWLTEAFQIVRKELRDRDSSSLFDELGAAGRMQQIELELMKFYAIQKDIQTAAKIAIRMLVEDEFTLPMAQLEAVRVLQQYVQEEESGTSEDVKSALAEYLRRVEVAVEEIDTHRATQSDADEMSEGVSTSFFSGDMISTHSCISEMTDKRRISIHESHRGDITMEMF